MRSARAASTATQTSNKLLVLIDGRSIYSTLHSGVFWELHQPLLEDIEQIEVISGPGGTLYGPNAVNGVINITTRDARETIGGLVRGHASATNERTLGARYGFALGGSGASRVYVNGFDRDELRGGARPGHRRLLSRLSERDSAPTSGPAPSTDDRSRATYFENETNLLPGDGDRGGNLTLRWHRSLDEQSSLPGPGLLRSFPAPLRLAGTRSRRSTSRRSTTAPAVA